MNRFFTSTDCISGLDVELPKDISYQLAVVLRAKKGDTIIVMDGKGTELEVKLDQIQSGHCRGIVVEERAGIGEPTINVTLYQALIKSDRFEYVLQKGVEVGVSRFVPFISSRTDRSSVSQNRNKRWHRIIKEAAEQSGRCIIPDLTDLKTYHEALSISNGLTLIPWEKENKLCLKEALTAQLKSFKQDIKEVSVFVGPVGGFTVSEINDAIDLGALPVSLGPRILRSETAGIVTIAAVLYEFGEI